MLSFYTSLRPRSVVAHTSRVVMPRWAEAATIGDGLPGHGAPEQGVADPATAAPAMLVRDTGSAFEVQALLPGVAREALNVSVDGKLVSIEGDASPSFVPRQDQTVLHSDPIALRYLRRFELPDEVDAKQCSAKLDHGVLSLVLPKRRARRGQTIAVE